MVISFSLQKAAISALNRLGITPALILFRLRALNARKHDQKERDSPLIDQWLISYERKRESIMKPLVGYEWPEGRSKQVAFISQDHHIHEFCVRNGGTWQHVDLTTLASAPLADSRFLIGFDWPEGKTKQVAYLGQDQHIHELVVSVGGTWQQTDLTAITGAPPAV